MPTGMKKVGQFPNRLEEVSKCGRITVRVEFLSVFIMLGQDRTEDRTFELGWSLDSLPWWITINNLKKKKLLLHIKFYFWHQMDKLNGSLSNDVIFLPKWGTHTVKYHTILRQPKRILWHFTIVSRIIRRNIYCNNHKLVYVMSASRYLSDMYVGLKLFPVEGVGGNGGNSDENLLTLYLNN